jgi:hypothetical protein
MSDAEEILPERLLRTMQIIAGVMLFGVFAFLGVAVALALTQNGGQGIGQADGLPIISILALLLLVVNIPIAFFIPGILVMKGLRQIAAGTWRPPPGANPADYTGDTAKLLTLGLTSLIVGYAPLEGAALFGCIAFMLEANFIALVAVAIGAGLMAMTFPTESRVRAWLQRQAEKLAQLRAS